MKYPKVPSGVQKDQASLNTQDPASSSSKAKNKMPLANGGKQGNLDNPFPMSRYSGTGKAIGQGKSNTGRKG